MFFCVFWLFSCCISRLLITRWSTHRPAAAAEAGAAAAAAKPPPGRRRSSRPTADAGVAATAIGCRRWPSTPPAKCAAAPVPPDLVFISTDTTPFFVIIPSVFFSPFHLVFHRHRVNAVGSIWKKKRIRKLDPILDQTTCHLSNFCFP